MINKYKINKMTRKARISAEKEAGFNEDGRTSEDVKEDVWPDEYRRYIRMDYFETLVGYYLEIYLFQYLYGNRGYKSEDKVKAHMDYINERMRDSISEWKDWELSNLMLKLYEMIEIWNEEPAPN